MEWITSHGADILAIFGAVVLLAGAIARLTPTNKDDEIVGFLKNLLDNLSPGGINKGRTK